MLGNGMRIFLFWDRGNPNDIAVVAYASPLFLAAFFPLYQKHFVLNIIMLAPAATPPEPSVNNRRKSKRYIGVFLVQNTIGCSFNMYFLHALNNMESRMNLLIIILCYK